MIFKNSFLDIFVDVQNFVKAKTFFQTDNVRYPTSVSTTAVRENASAVAVAVAEPLPFQFFSRFICAYAFLKPVIILLAKSACF